MARETDELIGEMHGAEDRLIEGIELALTHLLFAQPAAPASPHTTRQIGANIFAETEHFRDFADRTARAVMNDGGRQRRAMMAITLVDILNDFFAPLVFEIDIDVGRLFA